MYTTFVRNFKSLGLTNGQFSLISKMLTVEEQKPFFALTPKGAKNSYICFMLGNKLYKTPFKVGCPSTVYARLRTILYQLDKELIDIDIPLFIVRNGIPLNEIKFHKKEIELQDIDMWKALDYHRIAKATTVNLLRDLRDTLFI